MGSRRPVRTCVCACACVLRCAWVVGSSSSCAVVHACQRGGLYACVARISHGVLRAVPWRPVHACMHAYMRLGTSLAWPSEACMATAPTPPHTHLVRCPEGLQDVPPHARRLQATPDAEQGTRGGEGRGTSTARQAGGQCVGELVRSHPACCQLAQPLCCTPLRPPRPAPTRPGQLAMCVHAISWQAQYRNAVHKNSMLLPNDGGRSISSKHPLPVPPPHTYICPDTHGEVGVGRRDRRLCLLQHPHARRSHGPHKVLLVVHRFKRHLHRSAPPAAGWWRDGGRSPPMRADGVGGGVGGGVGWVKGEGKELKGGGRGTLATRARDDGVLSTLFQQREKCMSDPCGPWHDSSSMRARVRACAHVGGSGGWGG